MKSMTFMQACKDFFGLHPDETPMQFAKEVRQLTEQDRAEVKAGLKQNGYDIIESNVA